ncbi:MAG: SulP family inorganic anion transporter [Cytophagaceae bacterium]|nr:SulP family inorganic anion transporter [Cytophagaceae bacterium]
MLSTTKKYSLFTELKAGIVVFIIALPICLGITGQGVPAYSGILAAMIGGIFVTLLSGSKLTVTGPAAGLTATVVAGIATLGKFEYFLAALCLAGVIQMAFAGLKVGSIAHYFPSSVIKGFLSATGLILIFKQLPHIIGDDKDAEGDLSFFQSNGENTFSEIYRMFDYMDTGSMIIGLVSVILMFGLLHPSMQRMRRTVYVPISLLVVVVAVLLNVGIEKYFPQWLITPTHKLSVPVFEGFDSLFHFPDFSMILHQDLWLLALVIAVMTSMEGLLSLEAIDKLDPDKNISPPNRELFAQGLGNTLCGLIGGIPITTVVLRSSSKINAGGRTKGSTILHAVILLAVLLFIPNILSMIPMSALAAILLYVGYKLVSIGVIRTMYKAGWSQFLPYVVTIVVMMTTGIFPGIVAGLLVAIFYILKNNLKMPYKISSAPIEGRIYTLITLAEDVTFLNRNSFQEALYKLPEGSKVIIDGSFNKNIDPDILEIIQAFVHKKDVRKIDVELINL